MFPCVLKCQSVSKRIHTLIAHTKIWLKNFNDSAVPRKVPVFTLKVASRIAIYVSKDSRASRPRSVICRGKCYRDWRYTCAPLPPTSPLLAHVFLHLWADDQGEGAGTRGLLGLDSLPTSVAGESSGGRSLPGHRTTVSACSWPWNYFGT